MYVISMFSFRYTYQKWWAVSGSCQPLCYTYLTFFSSRQSQFQNCSAETGGNIFHYGWKQCEFSVFVCAQEQDLFSKYKDKNYLMIGSQLTYSLTPCSTVLEKLIVSWLTEKLSTFYQTQIFSMFAIAFHMSLSRARSVQWMSVILFVKDQFQCYQPLYSWVFQMVIPFGFLELKLCIINVVMLLCPSALDCTLCENHLLCQISLLVSFVLFGYVMECLYSEVFYGAKFCCSLVWVKAWDSFKICLFCTVGIEAV
jgi:hypothetical protein